MRAARAVGVVGLVVAGALLAAWLGRRPSETPLPTGSSYSTAPDGAQALFAWATELGAPTRRLAGEPWVPDDARRGVLLVIQPDEPIGRADRAAYDTVPRAGGTLVLAGDSFLLRPFASTLGVDIESTPIVGSATVAETGATVAVSARARARADGAQPLLVAPNGDWLALRKPYLNGSVVVFATPYPLTTEGLREPELARLVYRSVVEPGLRPGLAFDEAHHLAPDQALATAAEPASAPALIFGSTPGKALVYAVLVLFGYLLLGGRRLGPPLPPAGSARLHRTLFEQVQTLAGLYRRGRQLAHVRDQYLDHYTRLARLRPVPEARRAEVEAALGRVRRAGSDRELLEAVQRADQALAP
jgi:hypothetical protein